MAEYRSPLESPEAFAAYRERVKHQLKTQLAERIAFLESAHRELNALEALARRASNVPLVSELAHLALQADREAAALRGPEPAAEQENNGLRGPSYAARPADTL